MKTPALSALPAGATLLAALVAAVSLTACGPSAPPPTTMNQTPPPTPAVAATSRVNEAPSYPSGNAGGSQKQKQAEFLNRLRSADPQLQTIERAVLNDQNELGLIMNHNVSMDSIPALMKTMLAQMAKEFPGQDINVIAYAPSNPPMKIGTAHLDARTRDLSYTKAQP